MEVKFQRARNLMRNGIARSIASGIVGCALLSPALAAALGLGTIEHDSWLGEPLKAQIEVLDPNRAYNPEDLRLRQIYPEEAAALGIDVVPIRVRLQTKITRDDDRLLIRVSTNRPVNEPFLNFMLALEWPTGKSYREYSLLLDPKGQQLIEPALAQPAPAEQSSQEQRSQEQRSGRRAVLINEGQANRQQNNRQVITRAAPTVPISSGDNSETWRVRPGQTLSQIAQKVRIDSNIQLQAVTNHLYRSNPQAFEGGIDRLLIGANLRLPSKVAYAQMPRWRDEPVPALEGLPNQPTAMAQPNSNAKVDYTVQPGDTLSQVAQKMRQDPNISLQKVIDEIYQQNPDAFAGGMHRMKVGSKLELRGDAAMPSHDVSMNSVDVSDVSPQVPDASAFENTPQQESSAEVSGRLRLSDSTLSEEQILNGDLPSGSKVPVDQQIQMVSELTDKLNLENRDLRQRLDRVEGEDNIALLQELVLLQSKQIEHFQQQLQQTLSLLERQKGSGSLDGNLASLSAQQSAAQESQTEPAVGESANTNGQDSASDNELLSQEDLSQENLSQENLSQDDLSEQAQENQAGEAQGEQQTDAVAQNPDAQDKEQVAGAAPTTDPADIYEGQGVGAQLADQAKTDITENSPATKSEVSAAAQSDGFDPRLWISLFVAAILAALAWLDFRRPGGFLNRFNKSAQPESKTEPSYRATAPGVAAMAANEPVVRVRQREELADLDDDEPVVQVPLAPVIDPEAELADDDDANMEPLITGVARWNRKDIPMLQVEESEVDELSNTEKTDDSLNFDDFGLMNTISIDDLDINLDDGLEEGFKLDLDDDDDQQNKA